jgi:hypothetical protein
MTPSDLQDLQDAVNDVYDAVNGNGDLVASASYLADLVASTVLGS